MSGATESKETIQRVVRSVYAPVHAAGVAYVKAHQGLMAAADVVDAMGHAIDVIVAAEHLKDMATEAEKSVRSVLATQMNETGCTQVQAVGQMAYLSRKAAFVSVDQTDMVPAEYMTTPAPAPDKKAIKAAIEAGEDVPGCTLLRPNELQLNIKAKKG